MTKQSSTYQSVKLSDNTSIKIEDNLVIEAPLQININNEPYTVVMRTPGSDEALIKGLLYAEDICKKNEDFKLSVVKNEENYSTIINVDIKKERLGKGYLNKRTLLSISSCGICGKKELKDLEVTGNTLKNKDTTYLKSFVYTTKHMFLKMNELQKIFKTTGGSHACSIFNKNQELLTIQEDIGRHNAVDKCIGDLISNSNLKEAKYMLVSGRVSYEIVSKAFLAKIPFIIAVSACSSLAVDFAKEFGICLIGFSRDDKMTVYANPQFLV